MLCPYPVEKMAFLTLLYQDKHKSSTLFTATETEFSKNFSFHAIYVLWSQWPIKLHNIEFASPSLAVKSSEVKKKGGGAEPRPENNN